MAKAADVPAGDIARLRSMITQYFSSRALYAAVALDVAGALAGGPRNIDDLACATGAHAPSLYRVLRVLASSAIFAQGDDGRMSNTPLSELLRTDVPGSLRDLVLLFGDETSWRSWEGILHAVRTGEAPFEHLYGENFFDYLQGHPDTAAMFDRAMASSSSTTNAAVVEACDFSGLGTLVDVAGGVGSALCSILSATPGLRGVVFDLHMMMTNHGGRERTEKEYRALLATAGFKVERVFPTGTPWSVIEAKPAGNAVTA